MNHETETWRDYVSPRELAAYQEGRYTNEAFRRRQQQILDAEELAAKPQQEVSLTDKMLAQSSLLAPESTPEFQDPIAEGERAGLRKYLCGLKERKASCSSCSRALSKGENRTIVIHFYGGDLPKADAYCEACSVSLQEPKILRETDARIWELHVEHFNQQEIAKQVGVSQQTVSRKLRGIKEARRKQRVQ